MRVCVCEIIIYSLLSWVHRGLRESIKFAYLRIIETLYCHFELCTLCFSIQLEMFYVAVWWNPLVHCRLWIIWRKLWTFKAGLQLLMDTIPIQQKQTWPIFSYYGHCWTIAWRLGYFPLLESLCFYVYIYIYINIMFIHYDVMLFSWYCIFRVLLLHHICI